MTINALGVRNEYTASGGQTVFNFTFKIYSSSDLDVYITPSGQDADDATDLTTAYVVDPSSIDVTGGGFITLNSGTTSGDLVTIVSSIIEDRTTDYQNSGDFLPDTVNGDFDRVVSLVKQVDDRSGRTLSFPDSLQNAVALTLPLPDAGLYMRWNPTETGLENVGAPAVVVPSTNIGLVADMNADTSLQVGNVVSTTGYTSSGDGGDNLYQIVAAGTGTADGGSYIDLTASGFQAKALFPGGDIRAKQFAVLFDGSTDDSAQWQKAIDYVEAIGGTLIADVGISIIGTGLIVQEEGLIIRGKGRDVTSNTSGTVLRASGAINLFTFNTAARRARLQDMVLDGNGVGIAGVDIDTPKVIIDNCTVRGFTVAGVRVSSFSTWIINSDIFENTGTGVLYDTASCNDSHILLSSVSGNDGHGIRILSTPDGFFFDHVNMENNCGNTDGVSIFHHISIEGGVNNVHCTNMYHENSLNQTGFADIRFYDIEPGMEGFHLRGAKLSASVGDELDFFMSFGGNTRNCTVEDAEYEGYNTAFIDNNVGSSGSLRTENIRNLAINGFQTDLVDYAGAPTTAGEGLDSQTGRHYASKSKTATQTFTSATPVVWALDNILIDGALLDNPGNNGFRIKDEGVYSYDLNVTFTNYTTGDIAIIELYVNSTIKGRKQVDLNASGTVDVSGNMSSILKLEAGDLIAVRIARTTNNIDVLPSSNLSNLSINKIGIGTN